MCGGMCQNILLGEKSNLENRTLVWIYLWQVQREVRCQANLLQVSRFWREGRGPVTTLCSGRDMIVSFQSNNGLNIKILD